MADCDCVVGCKHPDHVDCGVQYCAMHEAAPALLEAAEFAEWVISHLLNESQLSVSYKGTPIRALKYRAAIAQAKGESNG